MLSKNIFREYDIRGVAGKDLTPDVARLVGRAFAAFLQEKGAKGEVAVGRDNRPSGVDLHRELVAGLLESGVDVVDVGVVPCLPVQRERPAVGGGTHGFVDTEPHLQDGGSINSGSMDQMASSSSSDTASSRWSLKKARAR